MGFWSESREQCMGSGCVIDRGAGPGQPVHGRHLRWAASGDGALCPLWEGGRPQSPWAGRSKEKDKRSSPESREGSCGEGEGWSCPDGAQEGSPAQEAAPNPPQPPAPLLGPCTEPGRAGLAVPASAGHPAAWGALMSQPLPRVHVCAAAGATLRARLFTSLCAEPGRERSATQALTQMP